MEDNTSTETEITTDRETIRTWVEDSGTQPGYMTDEAGERRLHIYHPERDSTESVEETTWDEFFDRLEDDEMVLVRHADRPSEGADQFELLSRTEAMERATLDDEEVEQALLEGEVVTSEIVETKVVERTVRETETIESEVVDSEVVRDEVIDSELVRREIAGIHLGEEETGVAVVEDSETVGWDEEMMEIEQEVITVDVDETRQVTREIIEQKTVESRVVDRDVEGTETLESDTLEGHVDLEGVHRTIVESDMLGGEMVTEDVIEGGHLESEFTDEETILTELYERRLVEDEVLDRKRLTFELVTEEVVSTETMGTRTVESELIGSDMVTEIVEMGGATAAGTETTTTTETTATETETTTATTSEETASMGDAPATDETAAMSDETAGMGDETGAETSTAAVTLDDDDVGKTVIDANNEDVGVISEVDQDANLVYVDPHPGLAKRIRTRLGWEGHDDDDYTVEPDRIEEITDDEIRLRSL
ncbi:hypothetical protein [Halorussus amylolyticus]|uniref:hypothetical protein n=1 Tax=Halorussus amylolyticus TaxID=1126242 RepID=UPI001EE3BAEE|nr:hypothetical protein [Halorussus amylolyticus]